MKKLFLLVLVTSSIALTSQTFAQFAKGDKIVNLGVGISGLGVNAAAEFGIADNIGVGAFFAYERRTFSYLYGSLGGNYGRSEITVGARAAYHLGEVLKLDNKLDPYVAAGLGAWIYTNPYADYDFNRNEYVTRSYVLPSFLFRVGTRYAFSEKLGGFADIGTGGSWIQAGVSFKF